MKNLDMCKIWVTYHDDKQINEYQLKEDDCLILFKGNDLTLKQDNINNLNRFYSELVTLYYVWKNNLKSEIVGFSHYRRQFINICDFDDGQCQVMKIIENLSIFKSYKQAHNYQDLYDVVEILNNKYGEDNTYSKYLLKGNIFIPFCCFIMKWNDFTKLCDWLFPILFAWDKKNGLNMDPNNYMEKAIHDFRYDDINYQCRAVAFLAERLISCYIVTEMKPFSINTL